ncbi:MAG TPA: PAS domain S-box protein [candidate division Zixibacteria bacterium]|nr:PAS domain S-box protein [candidate division Zixibacteria bacterium]MDD4918142.1 PAS domain S-box protein [candidate division Zixibacteria bacterium]MDM7972085.1 PAS domain S-box protein [candidate division Zixibacteria bacterium]HOD66151.1 PAS domain S-box protein [candidate division Zixibacteria bacterium]HOZ08655.1 PAS domain S-box protein [candidate division Zixibacteria bacterium]
MSRLSHLIIVQVVFVFAALVLIIFSPGHYLSGRAETPRLPDFAPVAAAAAAEAAGRMPADYRTEGAGGQALAALLGGHTAVRQAVLYELAAGRPAALWGYGREEDSPLPPSWTDHELTHLRLSAADTAGADTHGWPTVPLRLTEQFIVYGAPVEFRDGSSGLLVAAWDHNLFVSDRRALGYALLVLFLCAGLVALLTVYLIHNQFTQPFRRMIHRFERTSDGELYHMLENCGEGELNRLAAVFNKFSRTLLADQRELSRYDAQLRDASSSLEDSQRLLAAVIDHSPVGVITTDAGGRILLFNRRAGAIFGYRAAEALGRPIADLFVNDVQAQAQAEGEYEDEHGLEVVGRRRDRSQFAAYLVASALRTDAGAGIGYVYIVRDISQRKDFQAMIVRLDRYYTRGEMASEIAHEINNYLSILMGNIELVPLLLRKGNTERLEQKLEVMHGTVEKIARFTDGLLDGSHDQIQFARCDINQLVQAVVAFLQPQNRFDNTAIVCELSPDIPLVEADPGLLQQLLVNLVYNAGDAVLGSEGPRRIEIRTFPAAGAGAPTVGITVRDTGPGVAPDKLPLLFKRRFTTKPRGHGIGLIACRKILDSHGGDIAYAHDGGAVFSVTLPIEHRSRESAASPAAAAADIPQV